MKVPITTTWTSKDFPSLQDTRIYEIDVELYNRILSKVYKEREASHSISLAEQLTGVKFTEEQIYAIAALFEYWLSTEKQIVKGL